MNIKDKEIIIKKGDITEENSDVIVNPANSYLVHGGGAARAIATKAGSQVEKESKEIIKKIKCVPVGKAVITNAGKLKCKYVIHTVGPKMGEGDEDEKLKNAVWSSLTLADFYNLESISMPAISSGIFGFPKKRCAEILINTSIKFLKEKNTSIKTIIMCNFDEETYNIFKGIENSL